MINGKIKNGRGGVLLETALQTYANRAWHEEQKRLGRTIKEMAALAGKSRPTIVKWRFRLGLTNGSKRTSDNARRTYANETWLRTMIEVQHRGVAEVAQCACASVQTIEEWMLRFGIKALERFIRKERVERTFLNCEWLAPLVAKGCSNGMIADKAGCSVDLVARVRRELGLPAARTVETGDRIPERARIGKWLTKRLPRTKLDPAEHLVLSHFYGVRHPFRSQQFIARLTERTRAWVQIVRKRALRKMSARWRVPTSLLPFFFELRKPPRSPASSTRKKNGGQKYHHEPHELAEISQGTDSNARRSTHAFTTTGTSNS